MTAANVLDITIRPRTKFSSPQVKTLIQDILQEKLGGKCYDPETSSQLTQDIVKEVKERLTALDLPRYKFIVTSILGEMKGEGVRMNSRQFWDKDTDASAHVFFSNDSLFCACVAYGVYYY